MSELSSPPITLAVLELGHRACAIIPQVAVIKDNKSASTNIQRKLRPYISRKYKMESLNKAPRHHPNNYYYSNPLQLYVNYTKFIGNESAHTVCTPEPQTTLLLSPLPINVQLLVVATAAGKKI
jgi:hypothetical protein